MAKTTEELEAEIEALTKGIEGERAQVRIRGLARAKRAAEARLEEIEAGHKQALADLAKSHESDRLKWQAETQESIALTRAGIHDPAVLVALRAHVGTLPDAERKAGVVAFIEARQAAIKAAEADPAKAPKPIPWLDSYIAPKTGADLPPDLETGTGDRAPRMTPEDVRAIYRRDPAALKKFS